MKKTIIAALTVIAAVSLVGCGEKKQKDIIVTKKVEHKPVGTKSMSNSSLKHNVQWLGKTYTVIVKRVADPNLPIVKVDSETKYYDNHITVQVLRADGTEFFNRVFTKNDFTSHIQGSFGEKGALLGIVFVEVAGDNLSFACSVGSPDVTSDEYVPLDMKISRLGVVKIGNNSQLDTSGNNKAPAKAEANDDEDVEE